MESKLTGTAALVTGASSGIGAATARQLAEHGACVALVARRRDRLEALAAEIGKAGGTALAVEADITDRAQAEGAVQQAVKRFRPSPASVFLLSPAHRRAGTCFRRTASTCGSPMGAIKGATESRWYPQGASDGAALQAEP